MGIRRMIENWWELWRSLANSTKGIRWPMPGLGTITTWGFGFVVSMFFWSS